MPIVKYDVIFCGHDLRMVVDYLLKDSPVCIDSGEIP